ncbi:Histidine kinase-, DNA gyrase B-, and HSP90-like ATPase [Filimonas lacunae]|uniref:Oxygen sensor histidine kinase NreB n=1 Tax=Filimonas lacunae TaxID=477680 RepID=A0A173MMJ4_9BACT|nr:sensor histidine kinase [Filimonas lacunae]BAV08706.1 integral membrane sensor signal transduction histidine kinase [Filimonas lacunae]SIS60344.1 Histidine kinase-, DNA gyrase B-, and HSP90-like ATPase [Filimonas lacunae]
MKNKLKAIYWLQFICLLIVFHFATAQNVPQQNTATLPQLHDTAAINTMMQKGYSIREQNTDSSILLYTHTLNSSKLAGYNYGIGNSYLGLARAHSILNKDQEAIAYSYQALTYCTDTSNTNKELRFNIYHCMAQVYYYLGKFDSCAWYRYQALHIVELNPDLSIQVQMRAYGSILQFWMNVHNDIQHDRYIQSLWEHLNAIEKKAMAIGDSTLLVSIYFQKEAYYENIRLRDSSRYYCQLTCEMGRRLHVTPSIVIASLMNTAISLLQDKQPDKALEYVNEGLKEMPLQNKANNRYYVFAHFVLGEVYLQQKKYQAAVNALVPALKTAAAVHMIAYTDYAHKTLAQTYDALKDYKNAGEHWRLHAEILDSMQKDKKMELVYNVEMRYRIADKEREIAQKELSITRNKSRLRTQQFWIGGILCGTLLVLLVSLLLYRNSKHKHKLQTEKIRNLKQELQISSLQAMIAGEEKERSRIARELHDGLGGTLATIRTRLSYVFRKLTTSGESGHDLTEILQLLEEASVELRKTAHNLMPEILLREGLAKASLLFCERVRKGHMLEINTEIWGEVRRLPKDFELTAYRIIQELIHNTLKHARATQALVQIVFHESLLCITVEDNGTGITENNRQGEGMGLRTIEDRVKSLNGQMDIASSPGKGTSIYIELNIITTRQNILE